MTPLRKISFAVLSLLVMFVGQSVHADVVEYELTIAETKLSPAGQMRKALTINGGIPGPTLRFREGDVAKIKVHNTLKSDETSIHWHGLLVPNAQDGVPYLTTPPIKAGTTFEYEFPLKHPGTYWYHSHTGLQEQRGVYGSIVITPKEGEQVKADHDYVVVLSDWTNESPHNVMRSLMRGSEYYSIKKGNAQSILGAIQADALGDYLDRERSRMPPMDISDVYYDAFLLNGKRVSEFPAKPGETVRLRIINAGASTYFYTHFAGGPLTVVAADGPEVEPVKIRKLLMGMAETYDVVVTVPESGAWEFRATAQDNSGHASLFIGTGDKHEASKIPSPNLYKMDHMLDGAMSNMEMQGQMKMNRDMKMQGKADGETANHSDDSADRKSEQHGGQSQASHEQQPDKQTERPTTPYRLLRSRKPTVLPADAPVRVIELRLTGDMKRYIWSFNGKTLAEDSTIAVNKGEVLRLKLINDTMMHHPIHLHGHFFRLLNGQGDHAPLKHTVDVPPMGRQTIEFLANEEGDWFFHCHLLYHMDAGMARVFSYRKATNPDYKPSLDPKLTHPYFVMVDGTILNNMTMGNATLMTGRENFGVMWDYGFHEHKEYEIDLYWSHYFDANLSSSLGYRFTNNEDAENRAFAQVNYRLPYMIDSFLSLDTEGDFRIGFGKEFSITDRLAYFGDVEYDTNTEWEYYTGFSYLLTKEFSLTVGYHSEHGLGAGLMFRF